MTTSSPTPAPPATLRSLLLMGAVALLVFVGVTAGRKLLGGVPPGQLPTHLAPWALLWFVAFLVFVPGFLLAERAAVSRGRAGPYTLAVLVGCVMVAALVSPALDWLGLPYRPWRPPGSTVPPQLLAFLDVVVRVGLVAFIYARHRERLEAAQAIETLETRRNEMMGRLAASRLEAARARVQPEAFIAEVRALRASYVEDPATGGAGLEALIARLRAATRSPAS
jgi:hypothetical protein